MANEIDEQIPVKIPEFSQGSVRKDILLAEWQQRLQLWWNKVRGGITGEDSGSGTPVLGSLSDVNVGNGLVKDTDGKIHVGVNGNYVPGLIPFAKDAHTLSFNGKLAWDNILKRLVLGGTPDVAYFWPDAPSGTPAWMFKTNFVHYTGNLLEYYNGLTLTFSIAADNGYTGVGDKVFTDDGTFKDMGSVDDESLVLAWMAL